MKKKSLRLEGWTDFRKIRVKVRKPAILKFMQEEDDSSLAHKAVSRDRTDTLEIYFGTRTNKHFVRRVPSWLPFGWQNGDMLLATSHVKGSRKNSTMSLDMDPGTDLNGETYKG